MTSGIQNWGEAITLSLLELWERFIILTPSLIGAILVFLFGLIVAVALGKLAEKLLQTLRIDKALEKLGMTQHFSDYGMQLNLAAFLGGIIKWFLVLVFLMAATDILGLPQVTNFLNSVLLYLPNVVVAVIILTVVFLLGNLVYGLVKGSARAAGVVSATLVAAISRWAIIIFGILAALIQLGIATSLVNTLFMGLIAMLSLAGGLAFGLGGREEAQVILRKLREEISERK